MFGRVLDRLAEVHRTRHEVLVFTASGTGSMEGAVANTCSPGDRVLVVSFGNFGERWVAIAEAYGCEVVHLRYDWGETPQASDIASALAEGGATAVFTTQSETSTGVVADIEAISRAVGGAALLVVDAISSLGAVPLETDAWGVDVVVAGSQKALMTPPGPRHRGRVPGGAGPLRSARSRRASTWTGRGRRRRSRRIRPVTPFTPAITLVNGLDAALGLLLDEGLENVYDRHVRLGRAARAGVKALGLELFSPDEDRSAVVTAIRMPEGTSGADVIRAVAERHTITLEGGRGPLAGKIVRIGHVGYISVEDVVDGLRAVADVMELDGDAGASCRAGGLRVSERQKVLVREPIAEGGLEILRERFDVDVTADGDLAEMIGGYDALIVRSATKVTRELIERAERLKVIGRAGVGVDNVDLDAATERGIIVANAPQSTVISAAEHTIGLLLALSRNIPQAHAALKEGRWERSRYGGLELAGKTLGLIGFGRIGQQVARRASGLEMRVLAYDPHVAPDRFKALGVERAGGLDEVLAEADFLSLHVSLTSETRGMIGADELAKAKPGVRLVNAARGELVEEAALAEAVRSGQVRGRGAGRLLRRAVHGRAARAGHA